jgi:hypothetical protein
MVRTTWSGLGLLVALVVALPTGVKAQMTLGVGGGVVGATFTGDDAEDFADVDASKGTRLGIHVGGFVMIPIAERFSIAPGAYYIQKGAEYTLGDETATVETSYIEIPVLVSAALSGPESSPGFNLFAGPTFAFEVGCDISVEGDGGSGSTSCDDVGVDERESLDVGLLGGAGVSFPITETLSLMISAGYELGLRSIITGDNAPDVKNSAFFGSVHVGIPIGQ